MKKLFICFSVLMTSACGAVSESATEKSASKIYVCSSPFNHELKFNLNLRNGKAQLSTSTSSCITSLDASYRPTPSYADYKRFKPASVADCKVASDDMMNNTAIDSIKVSPELLIGAASGNATIIFDTGDYHGVLDNEKVICHRLKFLPDHKSNIQRSTPIKLPEPTYT